ncbi:DUF1833 domain-containing protein [Desulfococcaceae bacterium OttesenSCG-928-F15]|nr:DUF1833 domain-containing protein [Desulfococcaceae bacterium OttesenSCG-928-F15]
MDAPEAYVQFFLNCSASVVRLECLEISHPSFSQTYRVVRNATQGINVTYEDGNTYWHEYYPLKITPLDMTSDLDTGFRIDFGDLAEVLPRESAAVLAGPDLRIKPTVVYRSFRSDRPDQVLEGPYRLEVKTISYNREGCTFEAKAPLLNMSTTGELYKLDRFYPLRGFL